MIATIDQNRSDLEEIKRFRLPELAMEVVRTMGIGGRFVKEADIEFTIVADSGYSYYFNGLVGVADDSPSIANIHGTLNFYCFGSSKSWEIELDIAGVAFNSSVCLFSVRVL